jgi:hypothetical protein
VEEILEGGSHRVTQPEELDWLRRALRAEDRIGERTPDCLDDDTLAALADGTLDIERRTAVMPHVADCARCRRAVASVARALADAGVAREVQALGVRTGRRWTRIAWPLAAAALLLLVLTWPTPTPPHRGPPPDATVPVPLMPVGTVASAASLQWTAVPGADRYRVTLSEASGRLLYEVQVNDTVAVLPDSIAFVSGHSYVWLVEARTGFDRWSSSRLVEFSIAGDPIP